MTLKANLAGRQQDKYISKSELSKADLKIYLENSTLEMFGFRASYDCHSGIQYDVNTKEYIGNKILAGDSFLEDIQVGDLLILNCLVLEKNGKMFTTKGISFEIVD